jgi:carbamoyltransferase
MVCETPRRLAAQWGLDQPPPLVCMPHHENHASFSYLFSPFNGSEKPVMIAVCDGFGDRGAISLYVTEQGRLKNLRQNQSLFDSLGMFYSILSSTQGGWTPLSSEGRYMGAAAWGDGNRLTNQYYRRLRQIFHFAEEGQIFVNREMVNWHVAGELAPYGEPLKKIIGEPIPRNRMWNPDAMLCVDNLQHADATHDRVDLAAATQLVYEDALFHIVEHLIRTTRSDRLILTGGTALNCLANMQLLERFDEAWYKRNLGMQTRLHLWVPPTPGDAGVTMGAACSFAMRAGARSNSPMQHAFYCGIAPASSEIRTALNAESKVQFRELGNITSPEKLREVAEIAAGIIARDGVLGFYQGAAETGPRALGHRSIVANPCNPRTLETINLRVKFREPIRPLAPMATLAAAQRFWELSPGAADDDYSAYNYMVLTARAKPEAYAKIPAVIHKDGTSRVQIVREKEDPFTFAYLQALGRINGAEVSVNTSLNVGSPIAQTPDQALAVMLRAKDKSGMILIAADGECFLTWPRNAPDPQIVTSSDNRKPS